MDREGDGPVRVADTADVAELVRVDTFDPVLVVVLSSCESDSDVVGDALLTSDTDLVVLFDLLSLGEVVPDGDLSGVGDWSESDDVRVDETGAAEGVRVRPELETDVVKSRELVDVADRRGDNEGDRDICCVSVSD